MTDIVERLRHGIADRGAEHLMDEAADEIERLWERLGPLGLEVVEINGAGHYVNKKVKAEIERLRAALKDIAGDDYLPDGIRAIEIARRALERKP